MYYLLFTTLRALFLIYSALLCSHYVLGVSLLFMENHRILISCSKTSDDSYF